MEERMKKKLGGRSMKYMQMALEEAKKAARIGEIPVGAVIVKGDEVIASGYNLRETKQNALYHAEVLAIEEACEKLGSWRLTDCDLYVTLEPCLMCTGAILNARLRRVYFGAYNDKMGSLAGGNTLFQDYCFQTPVEVYGGMMEQECLALLKAFFAHARGELL